VNNPEKRDWRREFFDLEPGYNALIQGSLQVNPAPAERASPGFQAPWSSGNLPIFTKISFLAL